jgi:hypothetical protein
MISFNLRIASVVATLAVLASLSAAQSAVFMTAFNGKEEGEGEGKDEISRIDELGNRHRQEDFQSVFGENYRRQTFFGEDEKENEGLFNPEKTNLLVLDGGLLHGDYLQKFLEKNSDQLLKYVESGGNLLINASPIEGSKYSSIFGTTVANDRELWSNHANSFDEKSPLLHGPYGDVKDLTSKVASTGGIYTDGSEEKYGVKWNGLLYGDDKQTILAETTFGKGRVILGTLALNFSLPYGEDREAWHTFDRNLLSYAGGKSESAPVPEPASMLALGLGAAALLRRRAVRK